MNREIVLAFSLASAQGASSLKIAKDLGVNPRQIDLLQPPGQQICRIRPLAGENRKFAPGHPQVARYMLHLGRTAAFKLHQPYASAAPLPEPMAKSAKEGWPIPGLGCLKHFSLHTPEAASRLCFSNHHIAARAFAAPLLTLPACVALPKH
jgi:hypothetical protein